MEKEWVPLENSPEVFAAYSYDLFGISVDCEDVYDFGQIQEDDNLIVIYDVVQQAKFYDQFEEMDDRRAEALHITHLKQDIVNACGTIALLHCVANTPGVRVGKNKGLLESLVREKAIT